MEKPYRKKKGSKRPRRIREIREEKGKNKELLSQFGKNKDESNGKNNLVLFLAGRIGINSHRK
jgi:hypothetical protein